MPHALTNALQTAFLLLILAGLPALCGYLLLGEQGVWLAIAASALALLLEPAAASRLTLRLYRAQAISPRQAPALWRTLATLAERAGLPVLPRLYYVPSAMVNAFAVGSRKEPAIALSDGLLRQLTAREITGVLAHEVAHIAHGDLRVMNLADYVSRLTALLALLGQLLLLLALPALLIGELAINWLALLLLAAAPHIALLAQLGLSRVREFAADAKAFELTGDARGLAQALARIERVHRSWRHWLMPGWGNPEPSWLRTHPPTEQRIARLLALEQAALPATMAWHEAELWPAGLFPPLSRSVPHWRIGGYWW